MSDSSPLVIVKVGGSLLDWPEFPQRLWAFLASRAGERLVLIVGGGPIADQIRRLDAQHQLGDDRAHFLALRALDLTAQVLAALLDGLVVIEAAKDIAPTLHSGQIPVFAPRLWLDEEEHRSTDPLPHSWDVSTDTIAARLADRLEASELVLLKSATLPSQTRRTGASQIGLVDPAFPQTARILPKVTYLNLRDPWAKPQVLNP